MRRTLAAMALAGVVSACGILISPAVEAAPSARATESADARMSLAAAPAVTPALPLPRETISLTGAIGSRSRPVALQKQTPAGWQTIKQQTSTSTGRYRFSIIAATSTRTYRVVAPARAGLPQLTSPSRTVSLTTGRRWWDLNDQCRGDGNEAACRSRDALTKRGGPIVIRDLYLAWADRDYVRVRSLVRSSSDVTWYRNVRPATRFRDCSYRDTEWFCWVRATSGTWYSTRFEVDPLQPGRLPVWKGGALAPDV